MKYMKCTFAFWIKTHISTYIQHKFTYFTFYTKTITQIHKYDTQIKV